MPQNGTWVRKYLSPSLGQKCGVMEIAALPLQKTVIADIQEDTNVWDFKRRKIKSGSFRKGLNMWDTNSRFKANSTEWCGLATESGSGFLSKVRTSTSGSTSGFRLIEPHMRRWQSLSYLADQSPSHPLTGAEFPDARAERNFEQVGLIDWLRDAHDRLDNQLDLLRSRDAQLSYNLASAQLLNMKHKQTGVRSIERKAAELPQIENRPQHRQLHDKVKQMQKDLWQMRSSLDKGSRDELATAEGLTQRTVLNRKEQMNQKLSRFEQNHSEVQEQLSEANNKISQACLEKAVLSTQVLKLEAKIKELETSLAAALSDKDCLLQEKSDLQQKSQLLELQLGRAQQSSESCELLPVSESNTQSQGAVQMDEEIKALTQVTEKLKSELEMVTKSLVSSQSQLQELTSEKAINTKQITDLKKELSQLNSEKQELLKRSRDVGPQELTKMKQLRDSLENLESEKQMLQEKHLCLESEVLEKQQKLKLEEEEHQRQDAERVQHIEELKGMVQHWTEKWQRVALMLQSTQEELRELKRNTEKDSNALLRVELEACRQELELERSQSQGLFHRNKGDSAVHTRGEETLTDLSLSSHAESSLLSDPSSASHSTQNKLPEVQSREVRSLEQKLADRGKELVQKEEALRHLEKLREREKTEAQIKISALELKANKASRDEERLQADAVTADTLRNQLEESRKWANHLEQENMQLLQKLQMLKQLSSLKDERPSDDSRRDKTGCPVNVEVDEQRRMVTEQLKTLFKKREEKDLERAEDSSAAAETGTTPLQEWTQTSNGIRTTMDRRGWQQVSGLTPVYEEDEETDNWTESQEGKQKQEAKTHSQFSAINTGINSLKANDENLLEAVKVKETIQNSHTTAADVRESPAAGAFREKTGRRLMSLCPDGIFLAKCVNICSPDEEEED